MSYTKIVDGRSGLDVELGDLSFLDCFSYKGLRHIVVRKESGYVTCMLLGSGSVTHLSPAQTVRPLKATLTIED